ncbi:unnamed protein product [Haemonchus placei]|uniref:Aminopeptidase n=1 Tax=Haemonchus placei TaxID=6290 RepID=A0A0N4W9Y7_HAEPC|nr:unnamed protein product [Haemonchus placei]
MTSQGRTRTLLNLTPIRLIFALFLVAAAVGLSIGLTYYFTRKAFDTSEKPGKDDSGGKDKDNSPSAAELLLPTNIKPLSYDLTIKTYLPGYVDFPPEKNLTFDGRVEISMVVIEPTKSIVLNSKKISVIPQECELVSGGKKLEIESVKEHPRLEKVEFLLKNQLEKDQQILLKVGYIGLISNSLGGIYQTTYTTPNGTPKEISGDWITSKFLTTPRMSSYLLAVMVSEFEYIEGKTKTDVRFRIWSRPEAKRMTQYALESGIKCIEFYEDFFDIRFPLKNGCIQFRIWSRPEAKRMTQYALESGIKCIEFYEDFFDIRFPLKKQDMIALPDFSAGAMENWGLITYRENSLLYDDRFYAPMNKQRIARIVAHELAHQWFGDLVTMKWWDNLWLNEGFARYTEFIGAGQITQDDARMRNYFLVDVLERALKADSVASSHPLSFRIDKAAEVEEAFDDITYAKGASVLTMLRALIGEEKHKHAVSQYLKKFSYSNAEATDLWAVFDEVVTDVEGPDGKPMKTTEFASQWTTQMGFPVISVAEFNSTTLKLTQSRYKANKDAVEKEKYRHPKYGFKWDIPLWYQEGDKMEVKRTWLRRDEPLYLHVSNPGAPFVVNADRYGFYRQNHDTNGWKKIIKQLKDNHEVYSPRTRNAIISDAFAAAATDAIEYETVFELLKYAEKETEYLPLEIAMSGISSILKYFGTEPEAKPAQVYMMNILKPMYEKSSIDFIANNYRNDKLFFQIIAAPLRSSVYCYGVKEGGDYAFDKVMELYMAETLALEKDFLRLALGCHKDVTALKGLLLRALDRNSSFVRMQDIPSAFNNVAANPVGEEFIFNFLIERWPDIIESIGTKHTYVEKVIPACTSGIRSQQQIDQLKNLQKNGINARQFGAFDKAIERAQNRVDWIKKHFQKLAAFFKKATL